MDERLSERAMNEMMNWCVRSDQAEGSRVLSNEHILWIVESVNVNDF